MFERSRPDRAAMDLRQQSIHARRTEGVVSRAFGDETVVYDVDSERVTHLDAVTTAVWLRCDGRSTVGQVAVATGLGLDDVAVALIRLDEAGLLLGRVISRRVLLQRAGVVAVVTPLLSVAAATAAAASSNRTVNAIQTACSRGSNSSRITLNVSISGFTTGNVTVAVTYIDRRGATRQATSVISASVSGAGSTEVRFRVARGSPGSQTVTVTAQSQVTASEVTTTLTAITSC